MGSGKKIGIGVGVSVGVIFLIIVAFLYDAQDDARLAKLQATYFDDQDRLAVAVILTNADGEFTKANGYLELTILKDGLVVYSNEYDFTKNDFLTWDNLFTGKTRGVLFSINERFQNGDHDVTANLKTNSGYWEGLHASFYSLEPVELMVPEPIQQQDPESGFEVATEMTVEPEPIQQQVPAPGFEDVPEMIVESDCDPSYPDVCIPPYPPDLDCGDISYRNFYVSRADPHGFDIDNDGIGCES